MPQTDSEKPLRWLLVDFNAYFASVEQQERPELRGKPVAVVPSLVDTTCAIAASYEAKAFGIKTGTLVRDVRRLCPKAQIVEARPDLYVKYHDRLVGAVESCLPVSAVLSIDEMACRLGGGDRDEAAARKLAREVKAAVRGVGGVLRCSIGIAPNRFLAKLASDTQKPDGLVVLRARDLPGSIQHLGARELCGIGPRMERRLAARGVRTVADLFALTPAEMRAAWGGVNGDRFYRSLRGEEVDREESARKSIGHSHVLAPELRTPEKALAVAERLIHKVAARLRSNGLWARGFSLHVRFQGDGGKGSATSWNADAWSRQARLLECQDTLTLLETVRRLWKEAMEEAPMDRPFGVGVAVFDLVEDAHHTFSLFSEDRRAQLSRAMDRINEKFGRDSTYFGGVRGADFTAPMRIAFTQIPDEVERMD
ncbi:MAG: DNA polymerase [Deltaproteobacteria bacterium]|nr:DNA polymerase [Deltaproteobacteria bacterium]